MTVAMTAVLTARISVFLSAVNVSGLLNSSLYQYSENPSNAPVLLVLLKENSISTRMGMYRSMNTTAI